VTNGEKPERRAAGDVAIGRLQSHWNSSGVLPTILSRRAWSVNDSYTRAIANRVRYLATVPDHPPPTAQAGDTAYADADGVATGAGLARRHACNGSGGRRLLWCLNYRRLRAHAMSGRKNILPDAETLLTPATDRRNASSIANLRSVC